MTLFFQVYTYLCMFYMEALSYFLLTLIVFKSMFEPLLKNYSWFIYKVHSWIAAQMNIINSFMYEC